MEECKLTLEKSLFKWPIEVTCFEMNAISSVFDKEYKRALDEGVVSEVPQFVVNRLQNVLDLQRMVVNFHGTHASPLFTKLALDAAFLLYLMIMLIFPRYTGQV